MKTTDPDERITRWLDGAMSGAEAAAFRSEMERDPALGDEVAAMKIVSDLVKENIALAKPLPNADFFNSQIQEEIARLQNAEARHRSQPSGAAGWFAWLRAPWALAGAAALLAAGLFLLLHGGKLQTQVVSIYAPNPDVTATATYNSDADATVLMLDGLSAVPDGETISGLRVHHSDNDPEMASTTLYGEDGRVLLVMATDARNQPLLMGRALD